MFWVSLVDYALGMNIPRVCIYIIYIYIYIYYIYTCILYIYNSEINSYTKYLPSNYSIYEI